MISQQVVPAGLNDHRQLKKVMKNDENNSPTSVSSIQLNSSIDNSNDITPMQTRMNRKRKPSAKLLEAQEAEELLDEHESNVKREEDAMSENGSEILIMYFKKLVKIIHK